ncbi:fibronectin type III and SPRY domain-containing protein 2 [Suncus etruscus]|uniref:fibronectin type III and SPRY domain-containing protein 2 n=1 Tax=Suncus etruscus TaxID=109475 RepID=UPI0021109DCC|nr:fibronectin type III and SPRY domain-containing protein 2 [Suncus etruscus]
MEEEEEAEGPALPHDCLYYPMDLYNSEDRLPLLPGPTGHPAELGRAVSSRAPPHFRKDPEELARLYELADAEELGDRSVGDGALQAGSSEFAPYSLRKTQTALKQRNWRSGGEAVGPEDPGWGLTGACQDLREAYYYTHGRASEEYECYVIPEEDDEEEAPNGFCVTCRIPVTGSAMVSEEHREHEVTPLSKALEGARDEIHKNMSRLEQQILDMENFASHLEEVFITVEENFGKQEQNFESHYSEILETLAQKYEEKLCTLGERKREKLGTLYRQLLHCGESLDTCRELMETLEELCHQGKADFLRDALVMADRLGEFLKTDTDVEIVGRSDLEDQTLDFSEVEQLMEHIHSIPAPSAPVINPQAPNSATGSSVRVCWSLYSDDTVESYLLSYQPVQDGPPGNQQAELTMTVKETYCLVRNLAPNTQYEFWVTAQNRAGCSPASERAVYMTAPSPPIIRSRELRSCEEAALVLWDSGNMNPVDSYTLELTPEEAPGMSGVTESVVGIPNCEALVQLQPRQTYTICVRALNVGGPSARSQPAMVRTTGSCFPLNRLTCHPWLSISEDEDGLRVERREQKYTKRGPPPSSTQFSRCVAVLGDLTPVRGRHYWEVEVDTGLDYTVGVVLEDVPRQEQLGANRQSWCMRHTVTSGRPKYEFLHDQKTPDIRITVPPRRIGILLDYDSAKLSFFNVAISQHLFTFSCHFPHYVHPCFSLEQPGSLKIYQGIPVPTSAALY